MKQLLLKKSFALSMANTPSLNQSDGSVIDINSAPATPTMSSFTSAEVYSLPPVDSMALPDRVATPLDASHATLPDIMDSRTAANVPIRRICCIGAGYGKQNRT